MKVGGIIMPDVATLYMVGIEDAQYKVQTLTLHHKSYTMHPWPQNLKLYMVGIEDTRYKMSSLISTRN